MRLCLEARNLFFDLRKGEMEEFVVELSPEERAASASD